MLWSVDTNTIIVVSSITSRRFITLCFNNDNKHPGYLCVCVFVCVCVCGVCVCVFLLYRN